MKKRIAFVYHYFAHYRKPVFDSIIDEFRDEFDISFFSDSSSNEPSLNVMDFDDNIDFHNVNNVWVGKFLWQSGLFAKLNKTKPDVIVFLGQFNFISTWILSFFYRINGKKIIFWGHGLYGNETGLKKIVRNLFNKLPHGHMLYGHRAKKLMINTGFHEDKIEVIYNSLDYNKHVQLRNKLNIDKRLSFKKDFFSKSSESSIGFFVGRLTNVKRLDLILQALHFLNKKGHLINFIFVGDGPEMKNLISLTNQYNLSETVKFIGACHDEATIAEIIYSSDFCVSPGNVGLTAIHSLTFGAPVITHNEFSLQMPEYESISNGINGSFYIYDNIDSLIHEIYRWSSLSSNEREEIKQKCFASIENRYTPKAQAKLIKSFLLRNAL